MSDNVNRRWFEKPRRMLRNRNGRPDTLEGKPLPVQRLNATADMEAMVAQGLLGENPEMWAVGECRVLVAREAGCWHLSISHGHRDPSWREISQAWYVIVAPRLAPSHAGAMVLPQLDHYINQHPHCFHVHEFEAVTTGFQSPVESPS